MPAMSPVSRVRKKKTGQAASARRGGRSASPYAPILSSAEELIDETSMLAAERWASELVGSLWIRAWTRAADEPDEFLEAVVEDVAEYLVAAGSRAALAALRALAAVGEPWLHELAGEAGDVLADRGVREPAWRSGAAALPAGAYCMTDPFGEGELVMLAFDRDGAQHVVLVAVSHLGGRHLIKIAFAEMAAETSAGVAAGGLDAMVEEFRGDGAFTEVAALTGVQARARVEEPLSILLESGPDEGAALEETHIDIESELAAGWPLLRARLDLLADEPAPSEDLAGPDDTPETVAAFLASTYTENVADRELARRWAEVAGEWAWELRGSAHRYGPISLDFLLLGEVCQHVVIDEADQSLPEIIKAWAHFTADAAALAPEVHQLWDERLPEILSDFADACTDTESVAHRESCPDAYRLREYPALPGKPPAQQSGERRATPTRRHTSPEHEGLFEVAAGLSPGLTPPTVDREA
jgi:hypothetical protein